MIELPQGERAQTAALQFFLQRTERSALSQQRLMQQQSLSKLYQFAIAEVPYYRDRKAYPKTIETLNWQQLPILKRADVQRFSHDLQASNVPEGHGGLVEFRSSGSTGAPVHTFSTAYAQCFWRALTIRDHLWAARDFSCSIAVIKNQAVDKARYPGIKVNSWGAGVEQLFRTGPLFSLNSSEPLDRQYQWLSELQPGYLLTYPSALHELAKFQLKHKQVNSIKGVSTLGENLSDHTRTLVKQAFNCRIHDMYSSQEVGYMALQCPRHDHYHIQSESCLLEVLREDGTPCVPGEIGRVVVTPFHNFKMPLLRYEIGDYAISGEPCDCGIQLPVLQRIVGRSRNLVTYPDGRNSWPSYNPMALMKMFPMAQFQLEQTSLQSLRLNIAGVDVLSEPQKEQVIAIIQQAIDYAFVIDIVQVDSIERAKSGKFEEFISRIE